ASYFQKVVRVLPNAGTTTVFRPDGKLLAYALSGSSWITGADTPDRLEELAPGGWKFTTSDGDLVETYDSAGKLISITNRAGLVQRLDYYTSGPAAGLLQTVTDPFGKTLTFTYDSQRRIQSMTDPAGNSFSYAYDPSLELNRLFSITYPGVSPNPVRTYHYGELEFTSNVVYSEALTGITDENGDRFATFTYSNEFRAISSKNGNGGGVNQVTLTYNT